MSISSCHGCCSTAFPAMKWLAGWAAAPESGGAPRASRAMLIASCETRARPGKPRRPPARSGVELRVTEQSRQSSGVHENGAVLAFDLSAGDARDQAGQSTCGIGGSRKMPSVRAASGQCLRTRVLKLPDLVAAAAEPAQVITLHPQGIGGQPHRGRQTRSRLQRGRPATQHGRRWPRTGRHDCSTHTGRRAPGGRLGVARRLRCGCSRPRARRRGRRVAGLPRAAATAGRR